MQAFSILERIDVGETFQRAILATSSDAPFSILERIDVGETLASERDYENRRDLSVSSNGSTWVKLRMAPLVLVSFDAFQYPRTDRRG